MNASWVPPFYLYRAGLGKAANKNYFNDTRRSSGPPRLLLKYTISGVGTLFSETQRYQLPPGHMFAIENPGSFVYCYEGDGVPWEFKYVSIGYDTKGLLLPDNLRDCPVFDLSSHPELFKQFELLFQLKQHGCTDDFLSNSAAAYRFFLSYIGIRLKTSVKIPSYIMTLKNMIDDEFNTAISIAQYSERLGYSQETLIRNFKLCYGVSPGQYILRQRVRCACQLLQCSCYSIKEVCFKSGFASQNYFSRVFKKLTGVTPQTFRENPDLFLADFIQTELPF